MQMDGKPFYTVERVFLVGCNKGSNAALVFGLLCDCGAVIMRAAQSQHACEMFPPSRLDFLQDG
jgi:hypothetical protein